LVSQNYFPYPNFLAITNYIAWGCFILWAAWLAVGAFIATMKYKTCSIMLDESSLHLVKGIFGREEVAIPYRRIQSVDIKQPFSSRILGVARVVIATTTDLEQPSEKDNEANDEIISLMDYPFAILVQKELTGRAEVEKMQMQK
jgi:uncharacterized membrane protein YdbT with pleckstrin-like domain